MATFADDIYSTKVENGGATPDGQWSAADANKVRTALQGAQTTVTALESAGGALTLNSFGSAGTGYTKGTGSDEPKYTKDAQGRVVCRGNIAYTFSAASDTIFAAGQGFPAGYRPAVRAGIIASMVTASDGPQPFAGYVDPDGSLVIGTDSWGGASVLAGSTLYLDSISFFAAP